MNRLDVYLVEQGLFQTRSKAQDAIKEERIYINQVLVKKNSFMVQEGDQVDVKEVSVSFVSRAGFKLYDVIEPFQLSLKDRVVIDVGASTGGFSDVCIKAFAAYVYAVDVGSEQLDPSLRNHPNVCSMERVNCRYIEKSMFDKPITFACMDVSFISIKLILPALISCMEKIELVILIKPQFEAGKAFLNKHGIVKDEKVHIRVLKDMKEFVESLHLYVHHVAISSVIGRDGNKEFVFHIKDTPTTSSFDFKRIVKNSK